MNNDFFSLFFSQKNTIGAARAFNYSSEYGYPFDSSDNSTIAKYLVSNGTIALIHNPYTQDVAISTDGINWSLTDNLKKIVDYTKFGYGRTYGKIGGTEYEYPINSSITGTLFTTKLTVIGNKFIAFVLPINDMIITNYSISKSIYRFPKYVSTNGIDWTEETVQYSNTYQSASYISPQQNWNYYRPDETLLNMVICSGSQVNKKSSPTSTTESATTLYGYPSIQVSYDNGDNFQLIDCAIAMKNAVLALVNNNTALQYTESLIQPFMGYESLPRSQIYWSSECQKYFLFDLTKRTNTAFTGTDVLNSDGIIYYSIDLINWTCCALTGFNAAGRTLTPLKIGNRLAIIDTLGKMVEIVFDSGNANGFFLKTVTSNVPDTYTREMQSFLFDANSNSIIGLGQGRTTHSIAPYTGGSSLDYTQFTSSTYPQVQANIAILRINDKTVWLQMDATANNRPLIYRIEINPVRNIVFSYTNTLSPRTNPTLHSIYGTVNAIDKIDNTYYSLLRDDGAVAIISTTNWNTFNRVVYPSLTAGSVNKYGLLKSTDGNYVIISSGLFSEASCIRSSSNLQDSNSFAINSGSQYSALNTALTTSISYYYADHAYSSTANKYAILSAAGPTYQSNTTSVSKLTIVNSDLKTGIYTKANTSYGRTCLASDNSYWYCGAIGGIYRGSFNDPSLDEIYLPMPGVTLSSKVIAINTTANNIILALVAYEDGTYFTLTSTDNGSTWGNKIQMPSTYKALVGIYNSGSAKNLLVYDTTSSAYYTIHGDWTNRYENTIYRISTNDLTAQKFGSCRANPRIGLTSYNGAIYFATVSCFVEVKTI